MVAFRTAEQPPHLRIVAYLLTALASDAGPVRLVLLDAAAEKEIAPRGFCNRYQSVLILADEIGADTPPVFLGGIFFAECFYSYAS